MSLTTSAEHVVSLALCKSRGQEESASVGDLISQSPQ